MFYCLSSDPAFILVPVKWGGQLHLCHLAHLLDCKVDLPLHLSFKVKLKPYATIGVLEWGSAAIGVQNGALSRGQERVTPVEGSSLRKDNLDLQCRS